MSDIHQEHADSVPLAVKPAGSDSKSDSTTTPSSPADLRSRFLRSVTEDVSAGYPRLQRNLAQLREGCFSEQDRAAVLRLERFLRRGPERILSFRLPEQFLPGDEFTCEAGDEHLVVEEVRHDGDDLLFTVVVHDITPGWEAELRVASESDPIPLYSEELEKGAIVWRPRNATNWNVFEFSRNGLTRVAGERLVKLCVFSTVDKTLEEELIVGEVISGDEGTVVCWLEIEPGVRVKTALPRDLFTGCDIVAEDRFHYSIAAGRVSPFTNDDPELQRDLEELDREFEEELSAYAPVRHSAEPAEQE